MPTALRFLAATLLPVILTAASNATADVTPSGGMLRHPAVSDSRVAFIYANQIWTAPRSGGTATPVASPPGRPSLPRFSPDGQTLAFSANYDGNQDLYTVPLNGGIPFRVTHHPTTEALCGWADDDRLLFMANNMTDSGPGRVTRLYTVPAAGGLPAKLPMPYAGFGALSADGRTVAFTPHSTDNATWRRYRGGQATDLWLVNLDSGQSKRLTDWEGTDTLPMWGHNRAAKTLYYLSDNGPEHRLNIWACDTDSGDRTQITRYTDDDIRFPSIGPGPIETKARGEIVFQLGSRLMLLDLDSKEARALSITIPGARPSIRTRNEDAAAYITGATLSPSGKRVLVTARGDLWSLPAKEGASRNLTRTGGSFERDAAWSPDGATVAHFSDRSGEYELWLRPSDARPPEPEKKDDDAKSGDEPKATEKDAPDAKDEKDEPKPDASSDKPTGPNTLKEPVKLTSLGEGFRYGPTWSPDGKHIAFTDKAGAVILATLTFKDGSAAAEVKTIDTDPWSERPALSWSHDSAWLVYTRSDEHNRNAVLWLLNAATGEKTPATSPMFDSGSPAFDRKGEFLYYTSARAYASPRYADGDSTFVYAGTQQLMMAPLREDVKNPLGPRSDEEELKKDDKKLADKPKDKDKKPADDKGDPDKDEKKDKPNDGEKPAEDKPKDDKPADEKKPEAKEPGDKKPEDKKDAKKPLKIDLEALESRAVILPVPAGNYGNLAVTDDHKLLYIRRAPRGGEEKSSIRLFDPRDEAREEKTVTADAGEFALSASGKKLLVRRGNKAQVLDAVAGGGKPTDVPTTQMRVQVDPRAEWRQIIADTHRLQRDFFYVPNMHGVDWARVRDRAMAMLEDASSREDVQYIIGEMLGQLNIGHAYTGAPGDVQPGPTIPVGLLGCDFELVGRGGADQANADAARAYRIKKIYRGAPWDADARGPLSAHTPAGKRINEGDYLLAVNGVPLDTARDPWAALVGMADRPVTLTVSDQATLDYAHPNQREVLVTPTASDSSLRFRSWIERNRAYVAEQSQGKLGYIYVPNTGVEGQNELFRQFSGQRGLPGLIIDERWNGGGQIPTRFIELLSRPVTNYWARRDGKDWTWPPDAHHGVKCMLINGLAGSGGDMFPWLFKRNNLGKVIGTRTWGGLVGISGNPAFIDGGSMTVPTFGFYKTDGTWGVEGHGVDPDIEVLDDPALMLDTVASKHPSGVADPQLDAAITHCLTELTSTPHTPPNRPTPPDRAGMGIPERDR